MPVTAIKERATSIKEQLTIDYPKENERIVSTEYTFRLSGPLVEGGLAPTVSIDGGPGLPCRQASGYWWYDWSGYGSGPHRVSAQFYLGETRISAPARRFTVSLDGEKSKPVRSAARKPALAREGA